MSLSNWAVQPSVPKLPSPHSAAPLCLQQWQCFGGSIPRCSKHEHNYSQVLGPLHFQSPAKVGPPCRIAREPADHRGGSHRSSTPCPLIGCKSDPVLARPVSYCHTCTEQDKCNRGLRHARQRSCYFVDATSTASATCRHAAMGSAAAAMACSPARGPAPTDARLLVHHRCNIDSGRADRWHRTVRWRADARTAEADESIRRKWF